MKFHIFFKCLTFELRLPFLGTPCMCWSHPNHNDDYTNNEWSIGYVMWFILTTIYHSYRVLWYSLVKHFTPQTILCTCREAEGDRVPIVYSKLWGCLTLLEWLENTFCRLFIECLSAVTSMFVIIGKPISAERCEKFHCTIEKINLSIFLDDETTKFHQCQGCEHVIYRGLHEYGRGHVSRMSWL